MLTSLAVLAGAVGVWLGAPLADPIAGVLISAAIFKIVIESGKSVISRLLDGVEPEFIDEVRAAAVATGCVEEVTEIRVRWLGHTLLAEVNISVNPNLSVEQGAWHRSRNPSEAFGQSAISGQCNHTRGPGGFLG